MVVEIKARNQIMEACGGELGVHADHVRVPPFHHTCTNLFHTVATDRVQERVLSKKREIVSFLCGDLQNSLQERIKKQPLSPTLARGRLQPTDTISIIITYLLSSFLDEWIPISFFFYHDRL